MIDKIITLENGINITIFEKVKHNGKLFVLGVQVDMDKEEITNNIIFSEIKIIDNSKIVLKEFDSIEEKDTVSKLFMKKLAENAE